MFATLLAALLMDLDTVTMSQIIAYSASPLAYSLMLMAIFSGSKPRFIEKHFGMPKMYETHAMMSVYAGILVFIHNANFWKGFDAMFRNPATLFGYIGAFGLLIAILTVAVLGYYFYFS